MNKRRITIFLLILISILQISESQCPDNCNCGGSVGSTTCTGCNVLKFAFNNGPPANCDTQCAASKFNSGGAQTSCTGSCNGVCHFCSGTGSTNCISCAANHYLVTPGGTTCAQCPNGQFSAADNTATTCSACSTGCAKCTSNSATACTSCQNQYAFLSALGSCSACNTGFFYYVVANLHTNPTCTACGTGCFSCVTATTDCDKCKNNFFHTFNAITSKGTCTACPVGQFVYNPAGVTDTACTACDTNCYSCSQRATNCISCKQDHVLQAPSGGADTTCVPCPTGFFHATTTGITVYVCNACSAICVTCTDTTTNCLTCPANTFRAATGATFTCTACPDGFFKASNQHSDTSCTAACTAPCAGCINSATFCTKCDQDQFLNSAGATPTCTTCADGTYNVAGAHTRTTCLTCNTICSACTGSPTVCTKCKRDFKFNVNTCDPCEDGRFNLFDFHTQTTCTQTCDANCAACGNGVATNCTKCNPNFSLNVAARTCVACASGTFISASAHTTTTCTACSSECFTCSGLATTCLSCYKTSFLTTAAPATCSPCVEGTFNPTDGHTTNTACASSCDAGCAVCTGSATTCSFCNKDYKYVSASNTCTACPRGQFLQLTRHQTTTCLPCAAQCYTCSGLSTTCTSCYKNSFLAGGTCTLCTGNNFNPTDGHTSGSCASTCNALCAACEGSALFCTKCNQDFKFVPASNTCVACQTGRFITTSAHTIETCTLCSSQCFTCTNTLTECTSCYKDRFLTTAAPATCTQCTDGTFNSIDGHTLTTNCKGTCNSICAGCLGAANACTKCNQDFRFDSAAKTCIACTTGTFLAQSAHTVPSCNPCDAICVSCTSTASNCQTCSKTRFLATGASNTCTLCADGTFYDLQGHSITGACPKTCISTCVACSGSATFCTKCGLNRKFQANNCVQCQSGKFLNLASHTQTFCTGCALECHTCTGTSTNCLTCFKDRFLTAPGATRTCTPCVDGTYNPVDGHTSSPSCSLPCDAKCAACLGSPTFCTKCNPNYRFDSVNNNCIPCQAGKLITTSAHTIQICSGCATQCFSCTASPTSCLTCYKDRFLAAAAPSTCTLCVAGTFNPSDDHGTVGACFGSCNANCAECFGSATYCTKCKANNKLTLPGNTCTACSIGTYRPQASHTQSSCLTCDPTCHSCTSSATNCLTCFKDRFFAAGSCTECIAGTYNILDGHSSPSPCAFNCDPICGSCLGSAIYCLKCKANFKFVPASNTCSACQAGTFISTVLHTSISCTACSAICFKCSGTADTCTSCSKDRLFVNTGTCNTCPEGFFNLADDHQSLTCTQTCDSNCAACSGTATFCTKCKANFFFDPAQNKCFACPAGKLISDVSHVLTECVGCNPECYSCTNTPSSCLSCYNDRFLNVVGPTCTQCALGTFNPSDNHQNTGACASSCTSPCAACLVSATTCTQCVANHKFDLGTNTCTPCDVGTFIASTAHVLASCTSCAATCYTCSSVDSNCLTCSKDHFYVPGASGSCTICTDGTFNLADGHQSPSPCLQSCSGDCAACSGSATACTKCNANFKFDSVAKSCIACGVGQFLALTLHTTSACTPCSSSCYRCTDTADKCTSCKTDYYYDAAAAPSCIACGPNKFIAANDHTTTVCDSCHASCTSCSGILANQCTGCAPGFYLTSGNECQACPAGKGSPGGAVTQCTCIGTGCETCTATSQSKCLSCKINFGFDAVAGTCTACGAGKFSTGGSAVCQNCPSGCATCTSSTVCTSCNVDFGYQILNQRCTACKLGFESAGGQAGCICKRDPVPGSQCQQKPQAPCKSHVYANGRYTCTSCISPFTLNSNSECQLPVFNLCSSRQYFNFGQCIDVNPLCGDFEYIGGRCKTCADPTNFVFNNGECTRKVVTCNSRQVNINSVCVNVSPLCNTFDAAGRCLTCNNPTQFTLENGVCTRIVIICADRQYQVGLTCVNYPDQCAVFNVNTLRCEQCSSSRYVVTNGVCRQVQCPARTYFNINIGFCIQVSSECGDFNKQTGACTTCSNPNFIVVDGQCQQASALAGCRARQILGGGKCQRPDNCKIFDLNRLECTECNDDFILQNNFCAIKPVCDLSTHYFRGSSCIQKPANCLKVNDVGLCDTCSSIRFQNRFGICVEITTCGSNQYLSSDNKCIDANPGCAEFNPSNGQCISCQQPGATLKHGFCCPSGQSYSLLFESCVPIDNVVEDDQTNNTNCLTVHPGLNSCLQCRQNFVKISQFSPICVPQ